MTVATNGGVEPLIAKRKRNVNVSHGPLASFYPA